MAVTEATQFLPLGECVGVITHHSGFSAATYGEVPEKDVSPSAPVIVSVTAPEHTSGILALLITLPTTNTDGTNLARLEIVRVRMYHSTSTGVDTGDSYVDFPAGEALQWGPGDSVVHYVAVAVQDSHSQWSSLSNEASGTANAGTDPEYAGLWAHRIGDGAIWTEDSPDTNSIAWSAVILYWRDQKYTITDGSTDKKYIWWDYSASTTTFQVSDTAPTLNYQDVVIAYNDGGKIYLAMYSPMVVANFLRAGTLQSTNWAAAAGSQIDLDAGRLILGGSGETGFVAESDGSLQLGAKFTWNATLAELIMLGTYKTADINERIAIFGSGTEAHKLIAYDATGQRIVLNQAEIRIYEADTITTLTLLPSTPATAAQIGNDVVIIPNTLVVGRTTDPATADIFHLTGDGMITGELVVGDHNEGTTPSVANVIFYTTSPPAANTVPRGTLAFKVPA